MEKAIKKAEKVGYILENMAFTSDDEPYLDDVVLDPLFWQALGKAEGWGVKKITYTVEENRVRRVLKGGFVEEYIVPKHKRSRVYKNQNWKHHWHRFIDHLAEGKSPDSFFEELLGKE